MELLQQPEIKSTYDKCKLKVKYWEHNFKKKHGRLPSKLDIREADRDIRNAYKTYFNLKSAALEQSFQDIEGFNSDEETPDSSLNTPNISNVNSSGDLNSPNNISEMQNETELQNDTIEHSNSSWTGEEMQNTEKVWGSHLNQSAASEKKDEPKNGMTVNTNFAKKLFKNSNFSKRNPRKSLSFHHRKSETSLNVSKSLSQPEILERSLSQPEANPFSNSQLGEISNHEVNLRNETELFSSEKENENRNFFNNVKITSMVQPVESKSVNVVQSVLDENFKSSRNLDAGWIRRVAATSGMKMSNKSITSSNFGLSQKLTANSSDSDDIIGDSDEEDLNMHPAKRQKVSCSQPIMDFRSAFNESRKSSEKQINSLSFSGAFESNAGCDFTTNSETLNHSSNFAEPNSNAQQNLQPNSNVQQSLHANTNFENLHSNSNVQTSCRSNSTACNNLNSNSTVGNSLSSNSTVGSSLNKNVTVGNSVSSNSTVGNSLNSNSNAQQSPYSNSSVSSSVISNVGNSFNPNTNVQTNSTISSSLNSDVGNDFNPNLNAQTSFNPNASAQNSLNWNSHVETSFNPNVQNSSWNSNAQNNLNSNVQSNFNSNVHNSLNSNVQNSSNSNVQNSVNLISDQNINSGLNDEQMDVDAEIEAPETIEENNSGKEVSRKKARGSARKTISKQIKPVRRVKSETGDSQMPIRRTARQRKNVVDLKTNSDSEPEDPFDDPENADPEYNPNCTEKRQTFNFDNEDEVSDSEKGSKDPKNLMKKKEEKEKVPKTKNPRKKSSNKEAKKKSGDKEIAMKKSVDKDKEEEDDEENATYELEFSVKPRIKTVPRDPDLKNVVKRALSRKVSRKKDDAGVKQEDNSGGVRSKEEVNFDKLKKKVESGNLNDNFVRIDLKKKVYARGKKGMNFSKYKKKMWKQHKKNNALAGPDMDMGGCDGGMLTCFKCGKVGHFARNCQAEKGDQLLPLPASAEEYCPFPTLEEASQMAKESYLAVRAPLSKVNKEEGKAEEGVIPGTSSDSDDSDCNNDGGDEDGKVEGEDEGDNSDEELLAEALKLEEYVKKIDMQEYIDSTRSIKPYYKLKEDGKRIDTPSEVFEALEMFGHSSFRPGQETAIMRILSGQSTLVTLSTGSGKSLCYQLPAYLYAKREPCISLIISPLVSLMEDQVTGIPAFLKAACLHTNKTKIQREKILEAIGSGSLDVLLVSPEAVVAGEKSSGFGSLLRKLPPVAFACIDEAHCVSQWSHNFRPSYLMICRILKERLGIHTILGLTATATRATSDSIISHLSIPDGRSGIISDTPLPDNLRLTVSKDINRDHALLGLLLSERFENLKSVIVYCTRRQECERIASFLRTSLKSEKPTETNSKKRKKCNVQAEPYHAGLAASRRRTVQKNFMSGELRIVVATVAFGMGINKSDIRAVIHYNLPKNFESYVQEVGRAGRDGLPAHCHLFLDPRGGDENELQRHIYSDSIDRHVIRKLLQKIFIPCSCKKICPKHEVAFSIEETVSILDIPEENISTLLCYLELKDERYIEVLSPSYVICKVIAYGGVNIIRKAAKDCPPLAMALVMFGSEDGMDSCFEFPVVEVAAAMGWDSGICKHKLKNLEWSTENNQSKRTLITVQFVNLGFRVLAPGNLTGEQLDDTLDILYNRVVDQEKTALLQLHSLHETVTSVANQTYRTCISDKGDTKELKLKLKIREYFDSPNPLSLVEVKDKKVDEGLIANDVRAMISLYRDNNFTGRAIARIFYGISSPNYPAVIWGRCKFWRAHINEDFNAICRIATKEILRMR